MRVGREGFMHPDPAALLCAASGGSPVEPGKEGDLGYIRQEFKGIQTCSRLQEYCC